MIKVYSKALNKEIEVDRYIGKIETSPELPTVVFIAGIHGNEPSGVFALKQVFNHLNKNNIKPRGNVYAITGNMCALPEGKRFCEVDLNRIWFTQKPQNLNKSKGLSGPEYIQQKELLHEIERICERSTGKIYFIDLHTTSSVSCPFIPINDTMENRRFARKFPVPTVLGIEEFLDGPLLSYINEIDHIALGFEAGQHDAKSSIDYHIAFVGLVMLYSGIIDKTDFPDYDDYFKKLETAGRPEQAIYEIRSRFGLESGKEFEMLPGFKSFDKIVKDQHLATYNNQEVNAQESGKIFMPLYQNQGEDGFFIIRKIHPIWLKLSSLLRKIRFDKLLLMLPGVSLDKTNTKTMLVNLNVAKFYSVELFHLLGYRMKQSGQGQLKFTRREKLA
jgi:hypothetical protein